MAEGKGRERSRRISEQREGDEREREARERHELASSVQRNRLKATGKQSYFIPVSFFVFSLTLQVTAAIATAAAHCSACLKP